METDGRTYVPGVGPLEPKIVIVGESPSHEEIAALKPFVGPSGKLLNSLLGEAGINRDNCWVTNVCKYYVTPNSRGGKQIPFQVRAHNDGIDLNQQLTELKQELLSLKPNIIVALGGTALWALTGRSGIEDYRGSILSGPGGIKTIGSYHPAHVLYSGGDTGGYWTKQVLAFDLNRIKKQSEFREIRLPQRQLKVITNPAEFHDFLRRNKDKVNPAIDIEAWKCFPVCLGIAFTPWDGICIPLWNKLGLSMMSAKDLAVIWNMLAEFLYGRDIVGQNIGYDRDKIKRLGLTFRRVFSDTMLKAFCIHPELPKNLGFLTSIYTEEPFYKNEGMYEGDIQDLLIGCARDSCCTTEVNMAQDPDLDEMGTRSYYENFLLPLQVVYNEIEQRGVNVDNNIRPEIVKKYIEWDEEVRYKLFKLTGKVVNANSWQQVGKLLYGDWGIPERQGTGEEVLAALLNSKYVQDRPNYAKGIEYITEDRRVRKTLSSYGYAVPDFDGRMRTSYFLCLDTGRSSTQKQDPPIRPEIEYIRVEEGKKEKKKAKRGMAFQTLTKHGDIGPDIRRMLVPDPGFCFLQADSEQAEARVIFRLANDEEALTLMDTIDYHALTTSWFFGGDEKQYSKKVLGYECPERFVGKTLRHAGHLGAKARRAASEVNTSARKFKIDITISERKAENALNIFHNMQPKIRGVFQQEVIKCLEKDRSLRAPVPNCPNIELGGKRTFFERWGDELFRQAFPYIPQRTVSENTKGAALRIAGCEEREIAGRAPWIEILVESHDALMAQVPIERKIEAAQIMKEEMERAIDFTTCSLPREPLVIPCEIEHGMNYKDLSKFKWKIEEAIAYEKIQNILDKVG